MMVFINNRERSINMVKISFSTVVLYGLSGIPHFQRVAPTVTYRYANQTKNTPMRDRSSINLQEGMHFTVINGKQVARSPVPPEAAPAESQLPIPRVRLKPEAIERRKQEFESNGLNWPPHMTPEQIAREEQRVKDLMAPHEEKYQARQLERLRGIPLSNVEARLKDAYITINLLYQEAVAAGRFTPGRIIAGRLLYSIGYQETVKKLETA